VREWGERVTCTELVHALQSLCSMWIDVGMYGKMGSEVGGNGSEGLCVNEPVTGDQSKPP
jgi:hypothetical protein